MSLKTSKKTIFRKNTPMKRIVEYVAEADYKSYREFLKEDFKGRCGYCDSFYGIVKKDYHIDHFVPRRLIKKFITHKHLENDYTNLVYSCPSCNISKSGKWISENP
ncbi:HNH endonuclease, partial [Streptomyces vietnamensis]